MIYHFFSSVYTLLFGQSHTCGGVSWCAVAQRRGTDIHDTAPPNVNNVEEFGKSHVAAHPLHAPSMCFLNHQEVILIPQDQNNLPLKKICFLNHLKIFSIVIVCYYIKLFCTMNYFSYLHLSVIYFVFDCYGNLFVKKNQAI